MRLVDNDWPLKGSFGVVNDSFPYEMIAYPVKTTTDPTPYHRKIWRHMKGGFNVDWNYYPRGRVEIRRGKAIVYLTRIVYCIWN